jgi:choline dehydrogenase-like flavoprotein
LTRDLEVHRPDEESVADLCIVGSGAAGIVLAVDLLRQGRRVLMLEAGGAEVEDRSQEPYRSEVSGLPHRGIHTGRFRAKGGTTTRWGGQILEFDERDFQKRAAVPASGWPFPKSELQPFYPRALELEGMQGVTLEDDAVWREIGVHAPTFDGLEPYFSRWTPEPAFVRLHRRTLEADPNLDLWLHANAVEPILTGDCLSALRCRTLTGVEAIFRARNFVFCLGAIESSRFFLQPLPGGLPWNRSGLLGKHFQDHIDANGADVLPLHPRRFHQIFDNVFSRGFKYHPKLRLAPAIQERRGTLNVAATMYFLSAADAELARLKTTAKHLLRGRIREITAGDLVHALANLPLLLRQILRYSVQHRAYNPASATIKLRVHCEQQPDSPSSITLSGERDSIGLLRAHLDWQITPRELATMREYVLHAKEALAGVATIIPDPDLLAGNPAFLARCDDSNHHMGGMRMDDDPLHGVVDSNLRLHGTSNTYVCSGAVLPTSSFSNPTHTVLALTARLAEHLNRHVLSPPSVADLG